MIDGRRPPSRPLASLTRIADNPCLEQGLPASYDAGKPGLRETENLSKMPRLVLTPWKSAFLDEVRRARRSILLISPYVKFNIVSAVLREIGLGSVGVRAMTRCKPADFAAGASDIDAVYALSGLREPNRRFEVRVDNSLHAKIFVFDERVAYVGSSNLTFSGLQRNYEAVVAIEERDFVDRLLEEAERHWHVAAPATADLFEASITKLREYVRTTPVRGDREEHYLAPSVTLDRIEEPTPQQERAIADAADAVACSDAREPAFVDVPRITANERGPRDDVVGGFEAFLSILRNRFDVALSRDEHGWALAVFVPDFSAYRRICEGEDMASLVHRAVSKVEFNGLRAMGRATWDLGLMMIAARSGILRRFGPAGASMFRSSASNRHMLDVLWEQNLLEGPWSSNQNTNSMSAKTIAAYRMFGLIAILRGPLTAARVIEDFFDPTDLLGDDLVELSDLKESKTVLQEVAQSRGRAVLYRDHRSQGSSHDATWTCMVCVGGVEAFEGRGASKGGAETDAATRILRWMWSDPTWRTALLLDRQTTSDSVKRSGPWRIEVDLPDLEVVRQVGNLFRSESRLDWPDEVVFPAFVDRRLRSALRLDYDNHALAYVGSTIVNVAVCLQAHQRGLPRTEDFLRQVWGEIGSHVRVDGAWAAVNVRRDYTDAMRTTVIEALVGALVVRHGLSHAIASVAELVGRIEPRDATARATVATGTGVLRDMTPTYQDDVSYTDHLQHLAQAYADRPTYGYTQSGSAHAPVFSSVAGLLGRSARAEATTKRGARNRAAFELLLKLRTDLSDGRLASLVAADSREAPPEVAIECPPT